MRKIFYVQYDSEWYLAIEIPNLFIFSMSLLTRVTIPFYQEKAGISQTELTLKGSPLKDWTNMELPKVLPCIEVNK